MGNRWLWIGIAFLSFTSIAALAAINSLHEVHAVRPVFHGETQTYYYSGEVLKHTGEVLVNVYYLNRLGPENKLKAIQAYREANLRRSYALLARKEPKLIYVQVSFARPVPIDEVRSLVEKTSFRVEDFLMVSRPKEQKRWCTEATGDLAKPFCATEGFEGIMVLRGWVETTEKGLGQWLRDEQVYMVDTIAAELEEILHQKHADIVAGRKIYVSAEFPIWELDW